MKRGGQEAAQGGRASDDGGPSDEIEPILELYAAKCLEGRVLHVSKVKSQIAWSKEGQ